MLTLTQPDDWHVHFRDEAYLARTVEDTAKIFARALIMPNLKPPVVQVNQAKEYQERILKQLPKEATFQALMTLYLTSETTIKTIENAKSSGIIYGCKLYPQGATTNADQGIKDIEKLYPIFEAMEKKKLVLQIHGEVVDDEIDIFDREKVFIETILVKLIEKFPELKITLEHISSAYAVDFIKHTTPNCAATITAHHLLINRNYLLAGGIRPHYYCLPIVKTEADRQALIKAATSGLPKFFLGTDSAPHTLKNKESACGCAGIYTAYAALECYAEIFEAQNALDKLEAFASFYGADFYGVPRNTSKISLIKEAHLIPSTLTFGKERLIPFKANERLAWKILKRT